MTEVDFDSTMLDVEATFCYLGDLLCSGGGCDSAIAVRCCGPGEGASPRIRGKVYVACIRSAMLHGSEIWGPKELELRHAAMTVP